VISLRLSSLEHKENPAVMTPGFFRMEISLTCKAVAVDGSDFQLNAPPLFTHKIRLYKRKEHRWVGVPNFFVRRDRNSSQQMTESGYLSRFYDTPIRIKV